LKKNRQTDTEKSNPFPLPVMVAAGFRFASDGSCRSISQSVCRVFLQIFRPENVFGKYEKWLKISIVDADF
jgi:hypothetical protein